MNVYRYTFASECPMNGEAIIYSLEMRSEQRILVEHIKTACALHKRAFHEHIAADLSQKFGAAITLTANHHGVVIETQLAATAPSAPAAPVVTADAVRDAERYRWLRGHAGQLCAANGLLWESETDVFNNEKDATSLDAAIDWAMHSTDAREEEK